MYTLIIPYIFNSLENNIEKWNFLNQRLIFHKYFSYASFDHNFYFVFLEIKTGNNFYIKYE